MKKTLFLFLFIFFSYSTFISAMNKANESKEDPSCFPIFCLGCLSYCTSIATFHGTRALMPEDVTFPLTLSIITGIGTWNIGKQCCKLGQDYMKKQRPKEKIR